MCTLFRRESRSNPLADPTVSALAVLGFLAPVVRDVLLAPYPGPRLTEEQVRARLRECEVCGVDDPAEPLVAMVGTSRYGRIAAHQECGEARGYELEVPADPGVQLVLGNLSPAGGPARFSTVGAGAGSTGAAGHPAGTRSAVDAVAVPSQRGPGRGAATAACEGTGTDADPVNVYSVRWCPVDDGCHSCGAVDGLDVATADTPVGVLCLTLCGSCADAGDLPSWPSWSAAIRCVSGHAEHLGVTVDDLTPAPASPVVAPSPAPVRMLTCPSCTSSNVADLGGWAECRECGYGFSC